MHTIRPPAAAGGLCPVSPKTTMKNSDYMTGAELQTLREACNLTREELADLCRVQARTVKHWEGGRAGVPDDVGQLVRAIDANIQEAAGQGLQVLQQMETARGAPGVVLLIRYRSAEDLARYRPDMAGMPPGIHGAMVGRARLAFLMASPKTPVRIVWLDPENYEIWRKNNGKQDAETTRTEWAFTAIEAQAMPHRGDQPPGA